jgi:YbbR domain-containing protein
MMKKLFNSKPFFIIVSLIFALILFTNANLTKIRSGTTKDSSVQNGQMLNQTLHNIPVQLKYDKDKYFITGFEPEVSVYLSSYNRVRLDAETHDATRSFTIVANLEKLTKPGTYSVKLRAEGMSGSVTAECDPKTITVTVEKRVTKSVEVKPVVNESQLSEGFSLVNSSVSPKTINITTGEDTFKQIASVEADLPKSTVLNRNYSMSVPVKILNNKGEALPFETDTPNVDLDVDVNAPEKEVPLVTTQSGTIPEGISEYKFELSQDSAVISGLQEDISEVSVVHVPVDVTGITAKTTKEITLVGTNYSIKPKTVKVTIIPVAKKSGDSSKKDDGSTKKSSVKSSEAPPSSSQSSTKQSSSSSSSAQSTKENE